MGLRVLAHSTEQQTVHLMFLRGEPTRVGVSIGVAESCVLVSQSLGDLLDSVKGNSPAELQLRLELRDVLELLAVAVSLEVDSQAPKGEFPLQVGIDNEDHCGPVGIDLFHLGDATDGTDAR